MRLKDKTAVLVGVLICASASGKSMTAIAAVLTAVTVSLLNEVISKKSVCRSLALGYMAVSVFVPVFCAGLPFMVYDSLRLRSNKLAAAAAVPLLISLSDDLKFSGLCAAVCLLSGYIELLSAHIEQTEKTLRETRDDSAELTELLRNNNRSLIKLRDNEVYNATLRERNRIAREIHDNVGHLLTRCLLQMGALIVITKDEDRKQQLKSVQDSINTAMTSIRESVHDLHDDSIDLRQKVDEILDGAKERFRVSLDYDVSSDVSAEIKLAFIGILKESVNNAVKYSNGDTLRVSVQEYPGFCRIMIHDNGKNPDNEQVESLSGIGLSNMRERIASLGGSITIESSSTGFRVFASVPKRENTEDSI